jgi:hypothetical protein
MSFSELENDTLNQSELNEIKINENNQIFEAANPYLALRVYVKMKPVVFETKFNNERHLVAYFLKYS